MKSYVWPTCSDSVQKCSHDEVDAVWCRVDCRRRPDQGDNIRDDAVNEVRRKNHLFNKSMIVVKKHDSPIWVILFINPPSQQGVHCKVNHLLCRDE